MGQIILVVAAATLVLAGCFDPPAFMSKSSSSTLEHASSVTAVNGDTDASGVTTVTFGPSDGLQVLAIGHASSSLNGVRMIVRPNSFAPNTSLTLQEGASLANSLQMSGANTGTVLPVSRALVVQPSNKKNPILPFALEIPISGGSLALSDDANYVIAFQYIRYDQNEKIYVGMLPRDAFKMIDGVARFETPYFGSFQLVATEKQVKQTVVLKSSEAVVTKAAEVAKAEAIKTAGSSTSSSSSSSSSSTNTETSAVNLNYFSTVYVSAHLANNPGLNILMRPSGGGGGPYIFSNLVVPSSYSFPVVLADQYGTIRFTGYPAGGTFTGFKVDVLDQSTGKTTTHTFSVETYGGSSSSLCVWRGWVSSSYTDPANWDFCGGLVPSSYDHVAFDSAAKNTALASVNVSFTHIFNSVYRGGTLIIDAGAHVSMAGYIESDVTIAGSSPTCTTCALLGYATNIIVRQNATLTLKPGAKVGLGSSGVLHIGTAYDTGHLVASKDASGSVPVIAGQGGSIYGVVVEGPAGNPSSAFIDGLSVYDLDEYNAQGFRFNTGSWIRNFDNISFYNYGSYTTGGFTLGIMNCSQTLISDFQWLGLTFETSLTGSAKNVHVNSTCLSTEIGGQGYIDIQGASGDGSQSYSWQSDSTDNVLRFDGAN